MYSLLKCSFGCALVSAIALSTVVSSPADLDGHNNKVNDGRDDTVFSVEDNKLTREDVAMFLKEMRKLTNHSSSTRPSQSTTAPRSMEASIEAVISAYDGMIPLIIGATSAGLLLILVTIVVIFVCCGNKKSAKKDLSLNKDLNRWDPQLLRPSKENVDAFIFGSPIPSVAEMIKQ